MATGDSSNLKEVGIELGAGAYGTASGAFTHGLLVNEIGTTPVFAPEPIAQVGGSFQIRKTSKPPLFYDLTLVFPLDVGDNASGNIGHFLQSIMGTDGITGSSPYQHTFTRNDTSIPTWFNLWSDKDETEKEYKGFRANSVGFAIDATTGQILVTVSGIYQSDVPLAGPQSLVFSGSDPLTGHDASTWTLGGAAAANFATCEIVITRDNQRHKGISAVQTINNQYTASFNIAAALTGLNFANETEYDKYIAGTTTPLRLILTDANANYLDFNLAALKYNSWTPPAGSANTLINIAAGGFDTGDSSNIILQNARSTAYSA